MNILKNLGRNHNIIKLKNQKKENQERKKI